ncbi:MAG: DUF2470 domain-containing protein [Bacteroidota bacterium]
MKDEKAFAPKFYDMVINHMNDDHRPDMRDILKGIKGEAWVQDAELLHFDKEKIQFKAFGEGGKEEVIEIVYETPLEKPKEVRPLLVQMVREAREILNKGL